MYANMMCRLILIAEKNTVYNQFPTPLINRLEKHFVLTSSILEEWQKEVLNEFQEWIEKFSLTRFVESVLLSLILHSCISYILYRGGKFCPENAFIGFQTDTPTAIVFQTTNHLRKLREHGKGDDRRWETVRDAGVLENTSSEDLVQLQEDSEQWKQAVSCLHSMMSAQTV